MMKTKIKVVINGNEYLVESTYESGLENITKTIKEIVAQELLIMDKKN